MEHPLREAQRAVIIEELEEIKACLTPLRVACSSPVAALEARQNVLRDLLHRAKPLGRRQASLQEGIQRCITWRDQAATEEAEALALEDAARARVLAYEAEVAEISLSLEEVTQQLQREQAVALPPAPPSPLLLLGQIRQSLTSGVAPAPELFSQAAIAVQPQLSPPPQQLQATTPPGAPVAPPAASVSPGLQQLQVPQQMLHQAAQLMGLLPAAPLAGHTQPF